MACPKGKARPVKAGRKAGTPNKVTAELKDMILGALSAKGGQKYLEMQATKNPTAFLTLVGKVLPMTVAGDPANPLRARIEVVIVDPQDARPAKA